MRANFDVSLLSLHRTGASSGRQKASGGGQSSDFQQILQQQSAAPQPAAAPPAVPAPAAPAQAVRMAATTPSLCDITAFSNGGLMTMPTGNNALTGGVIPYNPNYYATLEAATEVARQVGGQVVDLRGMISNNQSEYFIDLPNGTRVNAGNVIAVLNNAVYQENSRVMDAKIAEVLNNNAVSSTNVGRGLYTVKDGHVSYDPGIQT